MQRAGNAGNLSALLGSEENKFATVVDRRRHSAQFTPVSCHMNKKQFISCITRLTGRVVPRVTLTVTLVTMGGLALATNVGSYDTLLTFFS